MPQHSTAAASSAHIAGNKVNLLQPADFAPPGTNLNHTGLSQCAITLPNGLCNGGSGHGGAGGGSGRRATKRTHEESLQEDRSDPTNGNNYVVSCSV